MTTYRIQDSEKGEISYRDKKRFLWFGSLVLTLVPLPFVYAFTQTQNSVSYTHLTLPTNREV